MINEKERRRIVRRYHESGHGRSEFARQNGIALSTLGYWIRQEGRKGIVRGVLGPMQLQELKLELPRVGVLEPSWAMEVVSPTGLTIRSREVLAPAVLMQLLRGEC